MEQVNFVKNNFLFVIHRWKSLNKYWSTRNSYTDRYKSSKTKKMRVENNCYRKIWQHSKKLTHEHYK